MELNYDCFRQVLLVLEKELMLIQENPNIPTRISFPNCNLQTLIENRDLKEYSSTEVFYAIHNLDQAGYIKALIRFGSGAVSICIITDITFEGHMFLKNVRDNGTWKKIKSGLAKVGGASLAVVTQLATAYIKQELGLP